MRVPALLIALAGFAAGVPSLADQRFASHNTHLGVSPQANRVMKEAPILAERVARGDLPALEKRLPAHPMIVETVEEPGLYGGTWRTYHTQADLLALRLLNNYYPLTRWSRKVDRIIPGIAESWEKGDGGRSITFHLREGLRWSDGEPFTSEDILFWWKLCLDKRTSFSPPEWAYSQGKRMEVRAFGPWSITFEYAEAFHLLPLIMATGFWVPESVLLPSHYLKKFHPDHSAGHLDFNELLRRNNPATNPERPTLGPWQLTYYSPTGDRALLERNPYYYAVDPEGRQLPYIDRIESTYVQNPESGVLLTISGAVDAKFREVEFKDYALLKRFESRGGYRVRAWEEGTAAWNAIFLNWSVEDPARRKLFRNPDFRRGLALAIDRERINQVVWGGLSRPQGAAITDESWHFQSQRGQDVLHRWVGDWSQHDPAAAEALLDRAGLVERDAEGFRLYEGRPLELMLEFFDDAVAADEAPLIQEDWARVGLRAHVRRRMGTDLWSRIHLGKYDMYMQHNSEMDLFTFPGYVFPVDSKTWHPRVGRWYASGGKEGEAPEGFMADLIELYERCKIEPDLEKRHNLVLDAIDIQLREGPFMIGTCGRQKSLVVVSKTMRNVPQNGILGPWAICQPGSLFPEQFCFSPERLYGKP